MNIEHLKENKWGTHQPDRAQKDEGSVEIVFRARVSKESETKVQVCSHETDQKKWLETI